MADHVDFIESYPNAIPDDLCDRLIATFDNHAGVYQGQTGAGVDLDKKNSRDLMLDQHPELQSIKNELLQYTFEGLKRYFDQYRMALMGAVSVAVTDPQGQATTLNPDNFDEFGSSRIGDILGYLYRSGTINIQCYQKAVGGYPHWHSEHYPQTQGYDALHRVALYMFYLNDVEQGGETEFFYQQRKIAPRKGTMVIAPAGFTHTHRGNAPVSNDKYIATSWVLFNPGSKLYAK